MAERSTDGYTAPEIDATGFKIVDFQTPRFRSQGILRSHEQRTRESLAGAWHVMPWNWAFPEYVFEKHGRKSTFMTNPRVAHGT